ncbi:hypothetical protein SRRS_27350 [Sporomusa rhizae]|uniref:sulfur carrier protein ThiS n=1 Tax=Sporomusa rhizae TaxID=357999 RepID=UPI00352B1295
MLLIVNGKKIIGAEGITIAELVGQEGFNPEVVIIEYNGNIVRKEDWQTVVLQQEDCLEVVSFVGGG